MNRMSLRLLVLMLLAFGWQILPSTAHAGTSNVSCTVTTTDVNFGSNINPNGSGNVPATGSVQFTCTNSTFLATQYVTLCVGLGAGTGTGSTITSRTMTGPSPSTLGFQVYTGSTASSPVWGNVPYTSNPPPVTLQFQIPGAFFGNGSYTSPPQSVYGFLPTPQSGVASGSYLNTLNGSLNYSADGTILGGSYPSNCGGGGNSSFSLTAQASVATQCTVSAGSPLILGSAGGVAAGTTNSTGSTTFNVTCTPGTTYNVGLAPLSTGSTTGAGLMAGTGTNTNKVPYQLYQTAAGTTVWGNTATSANTGNGVTGNGTGAAQTLTVYATAPGSDFKPDTYSDTVTINVNY
jgi:spore coat protein U-like protein